VRSTSVEDSVIVECARLSAAYGGSYTLNSSAAEAVAGADGVTYEDELRMVFIKFPG
jgi:hypothetical protein